MQVAKYRQELFEREWAENLPRMYEERIAMERDTTLQFMVCLFANHVIRSLLFSPYAFSAHHPLSPSFVSFPHNKYARIFSRPFISKPFACEAADTILSHFDVLKMSFIDSRRGGLKGEGGP
jgi:hypothetical protein